MGPGIKFFVGLLLIVLVNAGMVQAEEGDPVAGKEKSKQCQGCHGEDGNSINPLCPNLAGQHQDYIEKQIRDFQTKNRVDSVMTGMSQSIISDQDAKDVAAYFASRKLMAGYNTDKIGHTIFREGRPEKGVAACITCHGENGKGKSDDSIVFPVIGGQTKDYIAKQLRDLRSGARHNDPDNMMGNIAKQLSDEEINALADYISEL